MSRLAGIVRSQFRSRRQIVYELHPPAPPADPDWARGIRIERTTLSNIGQAGSMRTAEVVARFKDFLAEGQVGALAWAGNRVIAHAWVVLSGTQARRVNGYFQLQAREGLFHHCVVEPEFRGRGIYPAMICWMNEVLFREFSLDRIFLDTERDNPASRKSAAKAGFTPIAHADYYFCRGRLFFRRWRGLNRNGVGETERPRKTLPSGEVRPIPPRADQDQPRV